MSKSLNNCIYLSDSEEVIKQKVMNMFTDPKHLRVEDSGTIENNPVFTYLDAFCEDKYFELFLPEYKNLDELKAHYTRGGLGDVKIKSFLNEIIQAELSPIRTKREELEKYIPEIYRILFEGTKKARLVAVDTLQKVKEAMKINYFDDKELIEEQTKSFISINKGELK